MNQDVYVSFLRGINVGGHRKILMTDLKKLYENLGFTSVISFIQSGNIVFKAPAIKDPNVYELMIEQEIKKEFGFDVPVLIRTKVELERLISSNPFSSIANIDSLYIAFLSSSPEMKRKESFLKENYLPDKAEIIGKEVYLNLVNKASETKLTNTLVEKKLNCNASSRNWKTTLKMLELAKLI